MPILGTSASQNTKSFLGLAVDSLVVAGGGGASSGGAGGGGAGGLVNTNSITFSLNCNRRWWWNWCSKC